MIQKLKTKLAILGGALVLMFSMVPAISTLAAEQVDNSLCSAANNLSVSRAPTKPDEQCDVIRANKKGEGRINSIVQTIVNVFSIIAGIVAVIFIIYAGFRYVTSGGNQEAIKTAKTTLIYAIVGLIIVVLAQVIVQFVLNKATEPACVNGKWDSGPKAGRECT